MFGRPSRSRHLGRNARNSATPYTRASSAARFVVARTRRYRPPSVRQSDLECPACRAFHRALGSVLAAHSKDVSAVFVHYPLAQHRFAMAAARAVECAAAVGQFAQLVASFYDKQDSLGLKSWGSYAREAHIRDTTSIAKCATSSARVARVEAGLAYGNRIGVQFTPTIIINGWRLAGTPSQLELERIVQALLKGEVPFDTSAKVSD